MKITSLRSRLRRFFRRNKLDSALARQPYIFSYDDIKIEVGKDVFPPDLGFATTDLIIAVKKHRVEEALDMGTGTGIIALAMKKYGVKKVTAVDNHPPAIKCCKSNLKLNPKYSDIELVEGYLFDNISDKQFDLIVFNHPYSPANNNIIFGNGRDGGKDICTKFLSQARNHLNQSGSIIMSFSSVFGDINDPQKIGNDLGYKVNVLKKRSGILTTNYIYELR